MLEWIFLDLDNTLIDRQTALTSFCRQLLRRYQPTLSPQQQETKLLEMIATDDWGYSSRTAWYEWVAKQMDSNDCTTEALDRQIQNELPALIHPDPGIKRWLGNISQNFPLILITNGHSRPQRAKLDRAGIAGFFRHVIVSTEFGCQKPDLAIFEHALSLASCKAGNAIMIGDDLSRDIEGARRAGIRTCWVSHGRPLPTETHVDIMVESVTQISEHLLGSKALLSDDTKCSTTPVNPDEQS